MREKIAQLLAEILDMSANEVISLIEVPPAQLGDYAFPCFKIAAKLKMQPHELAEQLAVKIMEKIKRAPEFLEKAEAVGGYVNFFIKKEVFLKEVLETILEQKKMYGSSNLGKGKKILIEHTSLNPNSSPHLGRIRNALIGDAITRLLRFQGYDTEVHYYVNDVSKQVALLAAVCKGKESFSDMLNLYVKAAKKLKEKKFEKKVFEILKKFEEGNKEITKKINKIVKTCVEGQKKILSRLGINFDFFDYESKYMKGKKLKVVLEKLRKTHRLYEDEQGRLVFDLAGMGFEHKMRKPIFVLTRSDKTGLYALRDIAYTIDKLKRAEFNIIVLGEDQKLYFRQLSAILASIGYAAPRVLHYSFVLVLTKKGKKRMSTRKGELVLLEDFMKEAEKKAREEIEKRKSSGNAKAVAEAAIKYSLLKIDADKNVVFDMQEALSFEGDTGPYLQYTHARASSILRKAQKAQKAREQNEKESESKKNKLETAETAETETKEQSEKEYKVVKKLAVFPEILKTASLQLKPHIIAAYSHELAQAFNEFYHACPVLNAEKQTKELRLKIVQATKLVLAKSLELLGISAPEKM